MNQNDEREAFEAWAREVGNCERDLERSGVDENRYTWHTQQRMWEAWQARASLSQRAEVPQNLQCIGYIEPFGTEITDLPQSPRYQAVYVLAAAPQPQQAEQQGSSELSDKDHADYWRGRAIVAERKLAEQPRQMVALTEHSWRKKPVVIDAYQLPVPPADGSTNDEHEHAVWAFLDWCSKVGFDNFTSERDGEIAIETLEGTMTASPGDWIIKGVKGEFYPCKPDIFAATYEPAGIPAPGGKE